MKTGTDSKIFFFSNVLLMQQKSASCLSEKHFLYIEFTNSLQPCSRFLKSETKRLFLNRSSKTQRPETSKCFDLFLIYFFYKTMKT